MIKQTPAFLAAMTLLLGAGMLPAYAQDTATTTSGQASGQYESASKQCDTLTGDQKEDCLKQAETGNNATGTQPETGQEKPEADHNAANTGGNADHDAATKKCDGLSGAEQDKCEADAKTRHGK